MKHWQRHTKFDLLPEAIKDWLVSVEVTDFIVELNKSNKITSKKVRVIPATITKLVLGELQPQNFQASLAKDLNRDQGLVSTIVGQISKKILAPIADGLKTTQKIDLSMLVGQQSSQTSKIPPAQSLDNLKSMSKQTEGAEKKPDISQVKAQKPMSAFASMKKGSLAQKTQQAQQEKSQAGDSSQRPAQDIELPQIKEKAPVAPAQTLRPSSQQKTQEAEHPFMLHEEAPKAPTEQAPQTPDFSFELPQSNTKPEKPKPKVKFGSFFNRLTEEKKAEQVQKVESKKETPKVVHYSAFRTMLGDSNEEK